MSTPDLPLRMKQLKLHGMASQWPELLAKAQLHAMAPEHWMVELLQAESAERHVRAQANQMKAARFPVHRDLLGFEFSGCPVDRALVERLHEGHFIQTAENVVLVGGPGTGKTHLATAIGIQTVRQHRLRVRFFSTIELVNALEKEQAQNKRERKYAERWEHFKASVRAKVEHPFRVVKRQFGYTKVRYRGLAKNAAQVLTLFALSNLWMARRHLLLPAG